MALIAKYVARHRLRETRLLDTIADFLVKKAEYLDSKVPNHLQQVFDIPQTGRVVVWHIKKYNLKLKFEKVQFFFLLGSFFQNKGFCHSRIRVVVVCNTVDGTVQLCL